MVDEEAVGPLCSPKRTVCCLGEGKPLNLLTLTQVSAILSGIQSPADNWQASKHQMGFCLDFFRADSDLRLAG